MKKLFSTLALASLAFGMNAQAQTVTVGASGADFTSVQAAIDSINPTNGEPDVIEIIDGGDYDEQIVIGGLPPIDSASGNFITELVEQNRDPITIRGVGDKPTIGKADGAGLTAYGVFENDPGDNFNAGIAFFGEGITIENVEIRQPAGGSAYGLNGQAKDMTFRDVLFKPNTTNPEEDFINFNNSDGVAQLFDGTGNSAVFEDCTFDGELEDGSSFSNTFIYYHGINEPLGIVDSFTFEGCTFTNVGDSITRLRARSPENQVTNQTMMNCVFENYSGGVLNVDGAGTKVIDGCVFRNLQNAPDLNVDDLIGGVRVRGRSGFTGDLTIRNSIFSNIGSDGALEFENRAGIIITNDGNDPDVTIEHCTFDGNGTGVRLVDSNTRPRTVTIANSIFSNNVAFGISGDSSTLSYVGSGNEAELTLNIENCLFFNNGTGNFDIGSDTGTITGDPMYADTTTFALADGSPALGAATDGTDIGAVQSGGTGVVEFMLY